MTRENLPFARPEILIAEADICRWASGVNTSVVFEIRCGRYLCYSTVTPPSHTRNYSPLLDEAQRLPAGLKVLLHAALRDITNPCLVPLGISREKLEEALRDYNGTEVVRTEAYKEQFA